ncbi:MAG: type II secretion system F family protein [Nakamurella sp.]
MSSMLIGVGALAGALALAGGAVALRPSASTARIQLNLATGLETPTPAGQPRGLAPVDRIARLLTPAGQVRRLDRAYSVAGRPGAWPIPKLLKAKLLLAVVGLTFAGLWAASRPTAPNVLLGIVVAAVAYFVPDLLLKSRGQERQTAMGLELPDTLDQMSIAVEAGLGFESAMMRSAKNGKGPLSEELGRTLQDMQFGLSRREAYLALADRTTVADLRRFLRAVIQADAYGVAITDVLRTQAAEMRVKRRQRAETKAMQIPVKVIFPLMLCILPTLFIVLLGPAALNIMATFSKP